MRSGWARLSLLVALTVAACGGAANLHSEIRTGADGLRTFTLARASDGAPVLCPAYAVAPHALEGTVEVETGAKEPIWLKSDDGRHLSIVWPEGFTVRVVPDGALFNEKGVEVVHAGVRTELGQTRESDATGTYDDPYIAAGLLYGGCYPYVR